MKYKIKDNIILLDISPYPIYTSISLLTFILSFTLYLNKIEGNNNIIIIIGLISIIFNTYLWWKDIIKESLYKGEHNIQIKKGLNIGFILFIISETLIFGSFFFSFFYSSLIPDISLSSFWPPKGINIISPYSIPLLNTSILFFSGLTITASQYLITINNKKDSIIYILITLFLAILFISLQFFEYLSSPFSLNDSVFGSSFFLLTGFHGAHVIIGIIFIITALIRLSSLHFSSSHYLHFSFSALYYHFVDVVWIFLFLSLYLWS